MRAAVLLLVAGCAARHAAAPVASGAAPVERVASDKGRALPKEAPAPPHVDAAPAPDGRPIPDLPRTLVLPDGFGMYAKAPADTPVLAVGVSVIGEGPVVVPLGEGTGVEVSQDDDPACAGNVAFTPDWAWEEATGRSVTTVDEADARPALEAALGRAEFAVAGAWRVDLDGDGEEELLATLSVDEPTRGWSWVGILAGGAVTTLHEGEWDAGEPETSDPEVSEEEALARAVEQARPLFERAELHGLTDVEGDGVLELVLAYSGWESSGHGVSRQDGTRIGGAGCGV